jgi:hypothetical protein
MCNQARLQPIWTGDRTIAARLCHEHYRTVTGDELTTPPPMLPARQALPPSDIPWTVIVKGLRARVRPGGLELSGFTTGPDGRQEDDGCGWLLDEDALCDAVILASCYHGESGATRALVRLQLVRLLRGSMSTVAEKESSK